MKDHEIKSIIQRHWGVINSNKKTIDYLERVNYDSSEALKLLYKKLYLKRYITITARRYKGRKALVKQVFCSGSIMVYVCWKNDDEEYIMNQETNWPDRYYMEYSLEDGEFELL